MIGTDVKSIYSNRFSEDLKFRKLMWQVLCLDFFQRYFPPEGTVVEIGAGYCEFINSIKALKKIAVDINPDMSDHANPEVQTILSTSTDLSMIATSSVDRVFASNFFEHLSHLDINLTLAEVRRILKPGGMIVILQPNYRYCYKDYYMFFDHITALDHRSMEEVLEINDFVPQKIIAQFLPFTTKGNLPSSLGLLKLYLRLPFLWRIFGGQMLLIAAT
jgi:ubiquinone/menaquinone biosynthesis C-methylase UbiE